MEYRFPSEDDTLMFHEYLSQGYRRLDSLFYHACCEGCSSCLPIRLVAMDFTPSRSQKRTLRENEDLDVVVLPVPSITDRKVRIYEAYLRTKHEVRGETADQDPEQSLRMLHYGFDQTLEMDYYLGDRLIGVGIVDIGRDAVSSNYFYYDTAYLSRRLGIYSVMQEIFLASPQLGPKLRETLAILDDWARRDGVVIVDMGPSERYGCLAQEFLDEHHAYPGCFARILERFRAEDAAGRVAPGIWRPERG